MRTLTHQIHARRKSLSSQPHPSRQAREYMNRLMSACSLHPSADELRSERAFLVCLRPARHHDVHASRRAGREPMGEPLPRGATLCANEFDDLAGTPSALMSALKAAIYSGNTDHPDTARTGRTIRSVVSPSSRVETGSLFGDDAPRHGLRACARHRAGESGAATGIGPPHPLRRARLRERPSSSSRRARLLAEANHVGAGALLQSHPAAISGKDAGASCGRQASTHSASGRAARVHRLISMIEMHSGAGLLTILESGGGEAGNTTPC